jgi:hypothetical protein
MIDAMRTVRGRTTLGVVVFVAVALLWLATADDVRIWPLRNTIEYRLRQWWWERAGGAPPPLGVAAGAGRLWGVVRDPRGRPLPGARVLVSLRDGTVFDAVSGPDGGYVLAAVPAARYVPVAGAPGYADAVLGNPWLPWRQVRVRAGDATRLDVVLEPARAAATTPGTGLEIGAPTAPACDRPLASGARRRQLRFASAGRESQPTFLYTPLDTAPAAAEGGGGSEARPEKWPTLLTVYPGPAAEWECASLPLAAAGYAVLASGPAYGFELERDVDELARLLAFARAGALPGVDGERVAVLGGSYSALHVQRLQRRPADLGAVRAVVLLGAPSDLFDVRRRFEAGTFVPPFGLDQALIALGFPDREPLRYWRYSAAYHARRDLPPHLLIHSRGDDVVPFQQSEVMAQRMAEVGAPYRLHVFQEASHYLLSEDGDALTIYDLTLAFLGEQMRG